MKYNAENIIAFLTAINEKFEKIVEKNKITLNIIDIDNVKDIDNNHKFTMYIYNESKRYQKTIKLHGHKLTIDPYTFLVFESEGNLEVNLNDNEYNTVITLVQEIGLKVKEYKKKQYQEFFDEIINM